MTEKWYAVHTNAQKERLVDRLLKYQGFETLFLHFTYPVRSARQTRLVIHPLFNRYIFAGLGNGQRLYDINHTPGVSTVVYLADEAVEVPAAVIEELRARGVETRNGVLVQITNEQMAEHRRRFRKGAEVNVTIGPFTGLLAVVEVDKGHEVQVWLEAFKGRQVKAALDRDMLSPAPAELS